MNRPACPLPTCLQVLSDLGLLDGGADKSKLLLGVTATPYR